MAKKLKEDDAIEIKDKDDMDVKDQKDVKDSKVDESGKKDDEGNVIIATEGDDVPAKKNIKESGDHIIGIVSSGKLHNLEDGIMGVVESKIREKVEAAKEQIKAKIVFKGV